MKQRAYACRPCRILYVIVVGEEGKGLNEQVVCPECEVEIPEQPIPIPSFLAGYDISFLDAGKLFKRKSSSLLDLSELMVGRRIEQVIGVPDGDGHHNHIAKMRLSGGVSIIFDEGARIVDVVKGADL